jgi:hypothetical protein
MAIALPQPDVLETSAAGFAVTSKASLVVICGRQVMQKQLLP